MKDTGRTLLPILAATAVLAAVPAHAAFNRNPCLQNRTGTTITVVWESSTSCIGRVEYGLTTGYGQSVADPSAVTAHELTLTGLTPDTVFHYRVISASDTTPDWTFRSQATPDRWFQFFVYGDNRSDSAAHQSVVNRMAQQSPVPQLMLNVGDLTNSGATSEYWTFFNIERDLVRSQPLYPGLGNHDAGNMGNWLACFALPNNERWYSARYGNSSFICLDAYSTYTPGSAQYNWLLSELLADSADPAVRHIFVFFHEPPYTTNNGHSSNTTIRQYLCPLFERFGVDIAFQGHVHGYEHSLVNDVHYVISGGGGAPLHTSWGPAQPWTVYREATYEFTLVDVRGDAVFCKSIRAAGTVFDSFAIVRASGVGERPARRPESVLGLTAGQNPFTDRASVRFTLPRSTDAQLAIYNSDGHRLAVLTRGELSRGEHEFHWNPGDAPNGFYFAVLTTPLAIEEIRLNLAR
jgi:hypothetical protein